MLSSPRFRWAVLLITLTITVIAIVVPVEEVDTEIPTPTAAVGSVAVVKNHDGLATATIVSDEEVDDPFEARGWTQPVVVAAPVIAPVNIATPQAAPIPSGPPPLPYRFLGKMNDGDDLVIYLGRGEQTTVARLGETLEGNYKVLKITDQGMELEYLPTGDKQNLSFE